jgi:hypothetical protein
MALAEYLHVQACSSECLEETRGKKASPHIPILDGQAEVYCFSDMEMSQLTSCNIHILDTQLVHEESVLALIP